MSPISASASELYDPIEPEPTFYGYKILGYDGNGNTELSGEDYHSYVNQVLSDSSGDYPMTIDLDDLDETKNITDDTRFIGLPDWTDLILDLVVDMLANPTITASDGEVPEEQGPYQIYPTLQSVGKRRIYYSSSQKYELVRCELNASPEQSYASYKITRSFAGALYTYTVTNGFNSSSGKRVDVMSSWSADGYSVYNASPLIFTGAQNPSSPNATQGIGIKMKSYAVNNLPTSITSSSTSIADNNSMIIGTRTSFVEYAENTFQTNDYTYNLNHTNINNTNNYWNPALIYIPQYLPVSSNTVINQTNINEYTEYGYSWNETNNSVDFDPDVFIAWAEANLLPTLELIYKNMYQDFPDIDATIGDTDINYFDPFEQETDSSESGSTLPPATYPPGSGGGGMTPEQLDSVLNGESFYILDIETGLPTMPIDTLPEVDLPAELTSGAVGISNFAIDLLDSLGILPIFVSLSVLAFVVFTLKGG